MSSAIDPDHILKLIDGGQRTDGGRSDDSEAQSDDSEAQSWQQPVDLGPILDAIHDGNVDRPAPTIGRRGDGAALFYPGRVNGLIAESGDGKTWAALHAVAQEILDEHHVVYLDFEDTADGIVCRLLDLGVDEKTILANFHYFSIDDPYNVAAQEAFEEFVTEWQPTLVVIDSTGESMALDNVKPNDDDSVARWNRRLPRRVARLGPAVLILDHLAKSPVGRGLHAIGSQRKRAGITGASYLMEVVHEFGAGRRGVAKLIVAKDRNGTYVRGSKAAEFVLDATSDPIAAQLVAPALSEGGFRPTVLMERISRFVEQNPAISKNGVQLGVKGDDKAKRLAIEILTAERYIDVTKAGGAHILASIRAYREDHETT